MFSNEVEFQFQNSLHSDNWVFLSTYLREMESCFGKLKEAIEKKDILRARSELHQMLGATRILHFEDFENQILTIQSIVKGTNPSEIRTSLLSDPHAYLDRLFRYLQEHRPVYHCHLLTETSDYSITLQQTPIDGVEIHFTQSSTIEACLDWLSCHETDILIYDYTVSISRLKQYIALLESSGIDTPTLLVSSFFDESTPNKDSHIPNVCGRLLNTSDTKTWHLAIKTIVNGREYWQE